MPRKPRRLKLYQCIVRKRNGKNKTSASDRQTTGRNWVRRETIAAGIGAIGTLYRVDRKHGDALIPIYEARTAHVGKHGTLGVVTEDHTTKPIGMEHEHDAD
jgi:hypothetical protein